MIAFLEQQKTQGSYVFLSRPLSNRPVMRGLGLVEAVPRLDSEPYTDTLRLVYRPVRPPPVSTTIFTIHRYHHSASTTRIYYRL
jgi:hypothetical protein